jgi:hypothetical protein
MHAVWSLLKWIINHLHGEDTNSHSAGQKFLAPYAAWRLMTVFTTALHWYLTWITWIRFTTSHLIFSWLILILSFYRCSRSSNCSSFQVFWQKFCMHLLSLSSVVAAPLLCFAFITLITFGEEYFLFSSCSFLSQKDKFNSLLSTLLLCCVRRD